MVKKKESSSEEVSKEVKQESKKFVKFVSKNYWMIAAVLLAVVLVAIVLTNSFSSISEKTAEKKIIGLAELSGLTLTVLDVEEVSGFYRVSYSMQGQNGAIDISKDGKYIGQFSEYPEEESSSNQNTPASTEVPKSDKPKVELYVWGYCPYGVQAQGPMAQVAQLLNANADFEIVPYYDGHGAYETQQNKIQLCIQKLAKDKYWSYAAKFVTDVYPKCSSTRTEDCDKTESIKIMKAVGIDSTAVMSCVSSDGDALFAAASAKAQQAGVSGSPTVTINGVIANVARNAEAYKTAVCDAFNAAPSACSNTLSSSSATASGSC